MEAAARAAPAAPAFEPKWWSSVPDMVQAGLNGRKERQECKYEKKGLKRRRHK